MYVEVPLVLIVFSGGGGGGTPQNVDYTRSLGRRMLAQREEARRGSREPARRREESGEERTKGSRRELEALSQSMNRGPKLSLAPHRILPRTDLRFKSSSSFLHLHPHRQQHFAHYPIIPTKFGKCDYFALKPPSPINMNLERMMDNDDSYFEDPFIPIIIIVITS